VNPLLFLPSSLPPNKPLLSTALRAASEALFAQRLRRVNAFLAGAPRLGPFGDDGCAPLGG